MSATAKYITQQAKSAHMHPRIACDDPLRGHGQSAPDGTEDMKRRDVPPGAERDAIAECMRLLMEQQGVQEKDQVTLLAGLLGYTSRHARRKLAGETAWTGVEAATVARHFGLKLGQVLRHLVDADDPPPPPPALLPAFLELGDVQMPCNVQLSPGKATPPFSAPFVAIGNPENPVVVLASEITFPAREVELLVVRIKHPEKDGA